MPDRARVVRSEDTPHVGLICSCGWDGTDADVVDWDVQESRDRVVRCCPDCGTPVPEWGTIPSIDGARKIARGPLRDALESTV